MWFFAKKVMHLYNIYVKITIVDFLKPNINAIIVTAKVCNVIGTIPVGIVIFDVTINIARSIDIMQISFTFNFIFNHHFQLYIFWENK